MTTQSRVFSSHAELKLSPLNFLTSAYSEGSVYVWHAWKLKSYPVPSKWQKTHVMPLVSFEENLSTKLVGYVESKELAVGFRVAE